MRIVKGRTRNTPPVDWWVGAPLVCHECGAVVEYDEDDAGLITWVDMPFIISRVCPVCGSVEWHTASRYRWSSSEGGE